MCEEACPVDAIELTHLYDLTGFTRQDMIFDKEKLLGVFDQTKDTGYDPVRTHRGRLGPASDFEQLPSLSPATTVKADDRSARSVSSGVIQGRAVMQSSWESVNEKIEKGK
jgi:NADH-quinone oxidoreductase subunit I